MENNQISVEKEWDSVKSPFYLHFKMQETKVKGISSSKKSGQLANQPKEWTRKQIPDVCNVCMQETESIEKH